MENKFELLAPAGSMEALKAALCSGADAVYLGAAAFGARASVGFDEETLSQALKLAHLHRKKIYVTVNILVKDRELEDIRKTLRMLSDEGADAVILQDLGILKICREEFPSLPIHASTQMALHNASGAKLLKDLGAKRVVLARECNTEAIRSVAETGMEAEVFCHGALCVSVSGQCLFSSMIGGRSGNRGRCAQPCRLPYCYQEKAGSFLSPRDLCTRDELDKMAKAGAYSFKIEGRLKRPEYVAVVTRAYRHALDSIQENRFLPADTREKEALTQIFSRGGFTKGYPGGAEDAAIIDETRVTPIGVPMGKVQKVYVRGGALLCDVKLLKDLHNGDGLEIGTQEIRYSGPEMPKNAVAALRLRDKVTIGETVRRTEDESQLSQARKTYEKDAIDLSLPIPFDAVLTAFPGAPVSLFVTDGENKISVAGDVCSEAQHRALDGDSARRLMEKTGGTPFVLRNLQLKTQNAFLPAAAINALRREALDRLCQERITAHPRCAAPVQFFMPRHPGAFQPRLIVKTSDLSEADALQKAGAQTILFAPQDMRKNALQNTFAAFPQNALFCLPAQCTEETLQMLRSLTREYSIPVCASSPGQLGCFENAQMAGEGIPVMNGKAVEMLSALGVSSMTVSREMAKSDLEALPLDHGEIILPVYGRTRLMLLNHCPMRTKMHLFVGKESCDLCARGKGTMGTALRDRMGASYPLFPIRLPEGCVVELMADKPLHLSSLLDHIPPVSFLLTFTDETIEERLKITAHYAALLNGENASPLNLSGTEGRFRSGVI